MVTIPKNVADAMSIRDGNELELVQSDTTVPDVLTYRVKKLKKKSVKDFAGIFKGPKTVTDQEVLKWTKEGGYERLNLP